MNGSGKNDTKEILQRSKYFNVAALEEAYSMMTAVDQIGAAKSARANLPMGEEAREKGMVLARDLLRVMDDYSDIDVETISIAISHFLAVTLRSGSTYTGMSVVAQAVTQGIDIMVPILQAVHLLRGTILPDGITMDDLP